MNWAERFVATSDTTPATLDAAFLSHIERRELMIARDRHSGAALHFAARPAAENVEWVAASGKATLQSFTIFRQTYRADMPAPYNVAWVGLEEGPRLVSTVLVADLSVLYVGMPLTACFTDQGLLAFVPGAARGIAA